MSAVDLFAPPAQWVTLRTRTEDDLPLVVLVDQAVATTTPYPAFPIQVAVAVPLTSSTDGLPAEEELPMLKELEQRLVNVAAGTARLVAVMTLEGVREWTFYGRDSRWSEPLGHIGLSVVVTADPNYIGLRELAGLT